MPDIKVDLPNISQLSPAEKSKGKNNVEHKDAKEQYDEEFINDFPKLDESVYLRHYNDSKVQHDTKLDKDDGYKNLMSEEDRLVLEELSFRKHYADAMKNQNKDQMFKLSKPFEEFQSEHVIYRHISSEPIRYVRSYTQEIQSSCQKMYR